MIQAKTLKLTFQAGSTHQKKNTNKKPQPIFGLLKHEMGCSFKLRIVFLLNFYPLRQFTKLQSQCSEAPLAFAAGTRVCPLSALSPPPQGDLHFFIKPQKNKSCATWAPCEHLPEVSVSSQPIPRHGALAQSHPSPENPAVLPSSPSSWNSRFLEYLPK